MSEGKLNSPSPSPPVLCVGRDKRLQHQRQSAMDGAGIPARSITPEQAELLIRDPQPRLWIFCASIEMATLVFLSCAIRRHSPQSRLLLVEYDETAGMERSLFHTVLHKKTDPRELIALLQQSAAQQ